MTKPAPAPVFRPGDRVRFADGSIGTVTSHRTPSGCYLVTFSPGQTLSIRGTSLEPLPPLPTANSTL